MWAAPGGVKLEEAEGHLEKASEILRAVREEGAEYIITYQGRPMAVLLPVDEDELEDYVLSHHPHFIELREQARQAIREGEFATSKDLQNLLEE